MKSLLVFQNDGITVNAHIVHTAEVEMPILKNLKIAAEETRNQQNPLVNAKSNLLLNLAHQFKAAEAMVAGEVSMVTTMQTVEENGVKARKTPKKAS